jgi:hypothetical protein
MRITGGTVLVPTDFLVAVPTTDSHDAYLASVILLIPLCIWFISEGTLKDASQGIKKFCFETI